MITGPDLLEALPIIASLIVIESLLSVDNALAVAALAAHLPGRQKYLALRLGIAGAYVFRGGALALAAWIVRNEWMKIIGAVYLVYLMCSHLSAPEGDGLELRGRPKPNLFMTVLQIELLDLSLSLDNVIAAVAMSRKLWIVCTGVFIGILALRFLAGFCVKLMERVPVLADTAFVLVGYVGTVLALELATKTEVGALPKFGGILAIIGISIFYDRNQTFRGLLRPLLGPARVTMRAFAALVDWFAWPLRKLMEGLTAVAAAIARRMLKPEAGEKPE